MSRYADEPGMQVEILPGVDPQKTVRFEFPKAVLEQYGFRL